VLLAELTPRPWTTTKERKLKVKKDSLVFVVLIFESNFIDTYWEPVNYFVFAELDHWLIQSLQYVLSNQKTTWFG